MRNISSLARRVRGATPGLAHPLAVLGLLLATAGAARAQSFAPVAMYGTGASNAAFVATGDVNGDGRPDIVASNQNSSTTADVPSSVSVLLGQAGGGFAPAVTYATQGSSAHGVALADLNGDNKLDIAVANFYSDNVAVLLGTGTGTFGTARLYAVGTGAEPFSLAVADMNQDGKPDIVTANSHYDSGGVGAASVLLGTGTGTFGAATVYSAGTGTSPRGVALADLNQDARPDIILSNVSSPNPVLVLLSQAGGYAAAVGYPIGSSTGSYFVATGDVNRDGRPDVVATCNVGSGIGVLLGQAGGTLGSATFYATSNSPFGLNLGDVTGDGLLDIITSFSFFSNMVGVMPGTGSGTFAAGSTYATGANTYPYGMSLSDLNLDGSLDIVTANLNVTTVGVLLNLSQQPTLTSIAPPRGPVGTNVTLTGTNLAGATAVSFNGTAATTFAVVNATTVTATVPAGATTGNVTVTTSGGPSNGVLFTVTYPDLVVNTTTTIAAGIYNSITVNSPGNATLAGNVTVNTSTTVNSGATLNDGCFVLGGAGSFVLAAGGTLGICNANGITASGATGAIQNTGTRSFASDASYVYNGTAAQVTGNGLPSQVRNLTSTNGSPLVLSQAVSIAQVLTLNAGNLNVNNQALTLLSSASGTALVANLGAGAISGTTVTVQRYIDPSLNAGLGYRHLAAPVAGATTIASFGSGGTTPVVNSAYNSASAPGTVTPFPTIYRYDQSRLATSPATTLSTFDKGWVSPASLSDAANLATTGFTVQLPGASTLSFTGQVGNSTGSIPLSRASGATAADAGLNLIGNPYPAPLDLSTITAGQRTNMDAAFYVFESTSQYGGAYRSYVNGVASTGGSSLVGTAQAFFVRVTAGQTSGSLALNNSNRVTTYGQQAAVRRTAAETRPLVRLALQGASGPADGFVAYAQAGATAGFDGEYDAAKLPNSTGLNLSSATATANLSIDGQAAFTAATVLPLQVGVPAAGTYTLAAAELANLPAGLTAYLRDAQTGQITPLAQGTAYQFSVAAAEATALLTGRFTLQFSAATPLATAGTSLLAAEVTVYPNPAHGRFTVLVPAVASASAVQAELLNTLGQVVRRQSAALPAAGATLTVETAGLATGVYTLRLTAGASTLAKRVVLQ